ncbi:hypothetical protein FDECE_13958 [Fusarium decemcellulare]|nr:hypothetical protein FDECE_13958 [Fusarium decemcellulare]
MSLSLRTRDLPLQDQHLTYDLIDVYVNTSADGSVGQVSSGQGAWLSIYCDSSPQFSVKSFLLVVSHLLSTSGSFLNMRIPQLMRRALVALPLFHPWDKSQWTASDDTVRGGKSHSYLQVLEPNTNENPFKESIIKFYGNLDYETLGGSGFASQRTIDGWPGLDLSEYDSIILEIPYTDGKEYSFNLKDTVVPDVDGREQATISWEYNFQLPATPTSQTSDSVESVIVKFSDLQPTYRGTIQNDTAPLDLASIKRVNIMIRSFFAEQEGDFELRIKSIKAVDLANPYVEARTQHDLLSAEALSRV